jgi:ADP-ribose pyrophosphatase YjhB (NUDIX family)
VELVKRGMSFCTHCGGHLSRRRVELDAYARLVCDACEHIHYENPRVIVACAVFWKDTLLMCRRAYEPLHGYWTLPSGYLECGETVEEGAVRELQEETGVNLEGGRLKLHSTISLIDIEQIVLVFRGELLEAPFAKPGVECLECRLMTERELNAMDLAWPDTTRGLVRELFTSRNQATREQHSVVFRASRVILHRDRNRLR